MGRPDRICETGCPSVTLRCPGSAVKFGEMTLIRRDIRVGAYRFDTDTLVLSDRDGTRKKLRTKSAEVLACLAARRGKIVSKDELFEAIWPDVTVTEESLKQCIADIRRALEDSDQTIVKTKVGTGYCLTLDQTDRRGRFGLAVVLAAFVAAIGLGLWWSKGTESALPGKPRIAVLAFDDLSAGEDKGWLSDGVAEGVITELAGYSELLVLSRNSSFSFRDQATDVTKIASELDADFIVEGSKQKSGDRLRVTVQLLNGHDGTHIWAHEYDGDIGELFEVQSEIVRSISARIGYHLTWRQPRTGGRQAVGALDLFLQGNAVWNKKAAGANAAAYELYQKSIKADPSQPFGYSGMATLIWHETSNPEVFSDLPQDELLKMGFEYANKAVEADRFYYRSHIALGDLYNASGDHEAAFSSYSMAAEINPSSGEANAMAAEALLYLDQADEAIEMIDRAIEVDPMVPGWYRNIQSRALWWAGRCEDGLEAIKQRRRLRQWDYRAMIMNLVCLDRIEDAQAAGLKLLEHDPDFTVSAHQARVLVIMPPEYAKRWLEGLRAAGLPEN